jgi:hypothetical protein
MSRHAESDSSGLDDSGDEAANTPVKARTAQKSDPDAQLKSLASAVTRNLSASAKAFVPTSLPMHSAPALSIPAAAAAISKLPLGVTPPPAARVQHGFAAPPHVSPFDTPPRSSQPQSNRTPTSAGVKLSFAAAASARPNPSPSKPKLAPANASTATAAPITPSRGPPTNPRDLPVISPTTAQTALALLQGARAAPASTAAAVFTAAVRTAAAAAPTVTHASATRVVAAPVPRRPALIPDESPIKPLLPSPIKVPVPCVVGPSPVKEPLPSGNFSSNCVIPLSYRYILVLSLCPIATFCDLLLRTLL